MAQINLTQEEKDLIIDALNKNVEPSPEVLPKLFPHTAEKFDVAKLDRAKIPTLEYAGKRTKAAILAEATAGIGAAPLQTVRCFGNTSDDDWRNLIVQGDNLQFLKTCYKNIDPLIKDKVKGKVKLIYIDPPFATKSDFGGKDGEYSYADKVDRATFLETLRERLIYLREILADDGSIFIHLDQKMSHYVKIIMDELFGKNQFINEIIWHYRRWTAPSNNFQKLHDCLYWYSKTKNGHTYNTVWVQPANVLKGRNENYEKDEDGRLFRWQSLRGQRYKIYRDEKGVQAGDVWDISFIHPSSYERVAINYPTQKPEALLERIISSSTDSGDLVLDCFAGSGTAGSVAEKLGRRWIMCDFGKHSIYTMQKRMLRISESKKLGKNVKNGEKYGQEPKPFCVVSTGAYDFSHVMDLRKNKDTYVDFVLGLFQLVRDEEKGSKFNLTNIYTVKDNNPVQVYPVWDDTYLKEIRIDEQYLQSILNQTGGKLRGDFYIITPESCTNLGDTTLPNQDGKDVNFKFLTFPYKILEDISHTLELQEQPSSAANINELVTSTSFYFNDDVEIEIERVEGGLKVTELNTKILDKNGNKFEGLSGLAMLLIDLNFETNKPFDMDLAVYAKEIDENGVCKITGLTDSVGVIAIDKHGNESKPYKIK